MRQPVAHAVLVLPRPCGVALVRGPKIEDGLAAAEERDAAVHFFIDRWEAGVHRLTFQVRPEVSGTLSAPPAELTPMYADSLPTAVFGPARWVVRPADE